MVLKRKLKSFEEKVVSELAERADNAMVKFAKERGAEILYLSAIFLLLSGIMNSLLESGTAFRGELVPPGARTMAFFFLVVFGTAGLYLAYASSRQRVGGRIADSYALVGLLLFGLVILVGIALL